MTALSGGHLAVDFASGSVPALIPFMTDRFHLGYALAAMLLLATTASSSLVQPLFGLWSDRRGALWLIPGGAALAAVGVGGAAISPALPARAVLVLAGGLGVAAFHPEGAKFASYASGRRRASGMSYFNSGGNAGYALGAFATGQLVVWLGLVGGLLAMAPVLLAALALARAVPYLSQPQAGDGRRHGQPPWRRAATRDGGAGIRDRPAQRGLVHVARVRAPLDGLARALEGGRNPAAVPDAAGRRGGDAATRTGRGPDRAAADARRHAGARSRR